VTVLAIAPTGHPKSTFFWDNQQVQAAYEGFTGIYGTYISSPWLGWYSVSWLLAAKICRRFAGFST
jgi:hypothetical protein